MLTILLGTDWTANSDAIMGLVARDVADEKENRILFVPELNTHDTERMLCTIAGDTSSRFAEVLSFSNLVDRVAESMQCGIADCLDNGGRIVAMAAAIRNLHSKLKAYAAVETRPEFLTSLVDAVDEFKRCCISSKDILWAAGQTEGNLAQKLEELSLILESYETICSRGKRDPRDRMTWLLDLLEDCDFANEHAIYVDGFPDFTRQNLAILEHFILNSPQVIISMNCDVPGSLVPGFEKAGATTTELIHIAENAGIPVQIQTIKPKSRPTSPVYEQLLQGRIKTITGPDGCLSVYQLDTAYDECVAAANRIVDLVRSGVRYRDISVVCTDMATYRNAIRIVFDRCNIPSYLSGTEKVLDCTVITTVLAAIDAALGGFETRDVLRYLKSMLAPLDPDVCDRLENYAVLWNVSGKRWLIPFDRNPDGLGAEWTEQNKALLEQLESARELAIRPLAQLSVDFRNASDVRQQVRALFDFLDNTALAERLTVLSDRMISRNEPANAQILNQLWEILLTALEQMYDVLGDTVWDIDTFARLLNLLLGQYNVGTIPTVLDAVMVGSVSAMRLQSTDHLIVLGALEGLLPSYSGTSGVLTDSERVALREIGVPLTGGSLEGLHIAFSEIFGVFCGAQKTITVSCPGGQPSYIYRRLRDMAGGEKMPDIALGTARANKQEAAALLIGLGDQAGADALGISDAFDSIRDKTEYCFGTISDTHIKRLYGNQLRLSASQIDRQAECRFSYFMKYGLRAKERKSATVDPAEFGTYVHAVLELTGRKVMEQGGFNKVSMDETLVIARECSAKYAQDRFSDLDSERISYLFNRNGQELEMIVRELWDELRSSAFVPAEFELGFGDNGQMDAISINGTCMDAKLRGFVDRVDVWNTDQCRYVRVVDYKTGRKDFDYCDVFNGLGLQMLLYLFALQEGGENLFGSALIPAGVQYFPARAPMVAADSILTEDEAAAARQKLWKRKGLLLLDQDVLQAMEPGDKPDRLSYSVKKDGTVSGDVASREQFALLKGYVFALLGKMVDDIASGNVEPNPYTRGSSHNACTFCPYSAVCHPLTVDGRRNYKMMDRQSFWEYVGKEMEKNG